MTDNLLGQSRSYGAGKLSVEIGWRRTNDFFKGSDYWRPPKAFIRVNTKARHKEQGEHPMSVADLRELSRSIAEYADALERHSSNV